MYIKPIVASHRQTPSTQSWSHLFPKGRENTGYQEDKGLLQACQTEPPETSFHGYLLTSIKSIFFAKHRIYEEVEHNLWFRVSLSPMNRKIQCTKTNSILYIFLFLLNSTTMHINIIQSYDMELQSSFHQYYTFLQHILVHKVYHSHFCIWNLAVFLQGSKSSV